MASHGFIDNGIEIGELLRLGEAYRDSWIWKVAVNLLFDLGVTLRVSENVIEYGRECDCPVLSCQYQVSWLCGRVD